MFSKCNIFQIICLQWNNNINYDLDYKLYKNSLNKLIEIITLKLRFIKKINIVWKGKKDG